MIKQIYECSNIRDFLESNYDQEDLRLFAEDAEAFLREGGDTTGDIWYRFNPEVFHAWEYYRRKIDEDSIYAEWCQKSLFAIQVIAEKIVEEIEQRENE